MPDTSKVALIIGVDVYYNKGRDEKPIPQLPPCKNDAIGLYNLLSSKRFGYKIFENNPIIGSRLDMNDSFATIQKAIVKFFNSADFFNTLLFYFSGHGIPREDDEVFLATPEVDPVEPLIGGFRISDLTKLANKSRAARIVCIIDSCYSGAANLYDSSLVGKSYEQADEESAQSARRTSTKVLEQHLRNQGKYFLLSTQSYARSYAPISVENSDSKSIFTNYIIEGLGGIRPDVDDQGRAIPETGSVDDNGSVTPESLFRYVSYKVRKEIPHQDPVLKGSLVGDKIILAEYYGLSELLLSGKIQEFNKLRNENMSTQLDFSGKDLHGKDLQGANLADINFPSAVLYRVDFRSANLKGANLRGANLIHANLYGANLQEADLSEANLISADLSLANLQEANLYLATLQRANLYRANLNQANLRSANIHKAENLPISSEEARSRGAIL